MLAVKPIKFSHNTDSKCYFWGCTHLFHIQEFVWKARGYNSIAEYAEGIRTKINATCTKNDTLFLIGDGFLTTTPEIAETFLFGLNPKIQYLWGNHEGPTTQLYRKYRDEVYRGIFTNKDAEVYPLDYKNLTFWGNYLEVSINGQCIVLCHYPFKVFNNSKREYWHLHSHNHYRLASSLKEAKEGKILDVGVDGSLDAPLSFDDIKIIMDQKPIRAFDAHH